MATEIKYNTDTFVLPEGYTPPAKKQIVERITSTGLNFKGESVPWAIAESPTVLPTSLGNEIAELGDALATAYDYSVWLLQHGPSDARLKAEKFVRAQVPSQIPTAADTLESKRKIKLFRPDLVITSERSKDGTWQLRGGIAEVETRPAGTFMIPALMEGYGIDRASYMKSWTDFLYGRPWVAIYPKEWELYTGELQAFGDDIKHHGGEFGGIHCLEIMSDADMKKQIPDESMVYLFGYMDVWARSNSLQKASEIAQRPGIITYNPLNYPYETKATLTLLKQPWFQEMLAKKYGDDKVKLLDKWLIDSYVLNVEAPQDLTPSRLIAERNQWVVKRAGFDRDATESRGLVMPNDRNHEELFVQALQSAFSGKDTPWIAQRFMRSRIPQAYYRPDNDEVDTFAGSMRITPMYLNHHRETKLLGAASTVTYMSEKAHGGSGKEIKPGMSVMAPVVFGDTPGLNY